jgi:hypothetical protein
VRRPRSPAACAIVGTLSLYHGLSIARMSVVATLSAVLTAVIPAIVGLALGNHLTIGAVTGIILAIPAIGLVSWQPQPQRRDSARAGLLYGALAGLGFSLLFIALDKRAPTPARGRSYPANSCRWCWSRPSPTAA